MALDRLDISEHGSDILYIATLSCSSSNTLPIRLSVSLFFLQSLFFYMSVCPSVSALSFSSCSIYSVSLFAQHPVHQSVCTCLLRPYLFLFCFYNTLSDCLPVCLLVPYLVLTIQPVCLFVSSSNHTQSVCLAGWLCLLILFFLQYFVSPSVCYCLSCSSDKSLSICRSVCAYEAYVTAFFCSHASWPPTPIKSNTLNAHDAAVLGVRKWGCEHSSHFRRDDGIC